MMTQDQFLEISELASDGGQGGGDDGLIERREEHAQREVVEDLAHVRLGQGRVRVGRRGIGFGRLVLLSAQGCHSVKINSRHRVFPAYPSISRREALNAT